MYVLFFVAAVSHPDKKLKWIDSEEKRKEVIDLLKKEKTLIENNELQDLNLPKTTKTKEKTHEFSIEFDNSDNEDDIEDEIEKWVKTSKFTNWDDFPTMRKIYVKYNTALCSQALVERVFSFAKLIFGSRRGSLSDENFEKALMIKVNKKLNPELFLSKK